VVDLVIILGWEGERHSENPDDMEAQQGAERLTGMSGLVDDDEGEHLYADEAMVSMGALYTEKATRQTATSLTLACGSSRL